MRKMWRKLFGTAALAFVLCLSGLVMSGEAQAQQCVDNGDGTVTDNGNFLMWQKETAGPMNYFNAWSYLNGLSLGGHSGWRLPSTNELLGLYHSAECKMMMDVVPQDYWSATQGIYGTDYAGRVFFDDGLVNDAYMFNSSYVRAVRNAHSSTKVIRKF